MSLSRCEFDDDEQRYGAVAALKEDLGLDGAWLHTIDPSTQVWTSHACTQGGDLTPFIENEFLEVDFGKFAQLARRPSPTAVLSRETGGEPARSARYRNLLEPFGLAHEMRVALVAGGACWGGLCLVRSDDLRDFSLADVKRVMGLASQIGQAVRASTMRTPPVPVDGPGPGTILLDAAGKISSLSPEAEYWLTRLDGSAESLPVVVRAVAARTRAGAIDVTMSTPHAGVRATDGRWLELYGSELRCRNGVNGNGGQPDLLAITIGAARPRTLTPLLAEAFDLTPRERDVLALLLRGNSPEEIAVQLVISRYTARDHIKSIYSKAGVTSRPQLSARLLALNLPAGS